ncbi:MAG TPA: DNA helicase II [Xanthomonadaceae bacterium]|nr:DNA helicase II [Xanthomonadaceae bacterium]
MDVSHLLDALNPAQREAVCAPPGHYLVLAGAGSGKTRVLVHRIAWQTEVEQVPPHAVLAVTFTNKAAGEMRTRAQALMPHGTRGMWVGTFHGIAHRLLRLHWADAKLPEGFQVLDADDQQRLVKRVLREMDVEEARYPPRQAAWFINSHKDEGRRAQHIQAQGDPFTATLAEVYRVYQERCDRAGLVDFAELLLRAHELLLAHKALLAHYRQRFGHLLVDEFQDTNAIQYALVRVLAGESGKVFVVGDDDQAIYGWRGAQVENVQRFLRDFPGAVTLRLEQNYRSTGTILAAANAVIAHNAGRLGKKLWTAGDPGEPVDLYAAYNEIDEARFVIDAIARWVAEGGRHEDCAVLYRSNAQSRVFEEALIDLQMPYRVYGGVRFFERAEIKDTLAYLRLVASRSDEAAFERAVNTPARGIGTRTLDTVRTRARAAGLTLWDAARAEAEGTALAPRARNALRAFLELVDALERELAELPLAAKIDHVLDRSGLREHYARESRGSVDSRTDNLDELVTVATRFVPGGEAVEAGMTELVAFLGYAALEAGEGQVREGEDGVQLMTLHSAKGLEFPLVFVTGLEEGLFPSPKSIQESGRLEEERRLAYVGMTRAREKLVLCYAESRRLHGMDIHGIPSRFVREIPTELLHEVRPRVQVSRPVMAPRYAAEPDMGGLALGQRVVHPSFGEGVVTDYEGAGAHARVQVNFEAEGSKWLVVAYANLSPA